MALRPYTVIYMNQQTRKISHAVVQCESRSDAFLMVDRIADEPLVKDWSDVLYVGQTDDVEAAYTLCRSALDVEAEKTRQRSDELMVLAEAVNSALEGLG
jgi:hypothetical protein